MNVTCTHEADVTIIVDAILVAVSVAVFFSVIWKIHPAVFFGVASAVFYKENFWRPGFVFSRCRSLF